MPNSRRGSPDSYSRNCQINFNSLPQKWSVEMMGERDYKVMCGECQLSLAE